MRNNRLLFLSVLLMIALMVVQGFLHFLHPSYRYYKRNIEELRKRQDDFEAKVANDFVPAIVGVLSNSVPSTVSSVASGVASKTAHAITEIIASPFFVNAYGILRRGFQYNGRSYCLGDRFYGSVVSYIDDTIFRLEDGSVFVFRPPSPVTSPVAIVQANQQKKEI